VRHTEQDLSKEPLPRRRARAQAASIALAVAPFGIAFGAAAADAGLEPWQAAGFSLFVFAGSAQFAAVEILGDGGGIAAAVTAGLLLNLRSVAFGIALVDAMPTSRWRRALAAQLMIDETAAVATVQPDRDTSRYAYWFTGMALFAVWNVSTLVGATVVASSADLIHDLGLDATVPAAFLALLWPRLVEPTHRVVAVAGAAIAVLMTPFVPPGLPVILALIAVVPFLSVRGEEAA
jgi:4-azaleucine resistance transporter AzlC